MLRGSPAWPACPSVIRTTPPRWCAPRPARGCASWTPCRHPTWRACSTTMRDGSRRPSSRPIAAVPSPALSATGARRPTARSPSSSTAGCATRSSGWAATRCACCGSQMPISACCRPTWPSPSGWSRSSAATAFRARWWSITPRTPTRGWPTSFACSPLPASSARGSSRSRPRTRKRCASSTGRTSRPRSTTSCCRCSRMPACRCPPT